MSLIHDKTPYVAGAVPEVLLRQVWHASAVDPAVRLRLAQIGVLSLDLFANMSENSEGFLKDMAKVIGGEHPFGKDADEIINQAKIVSSWRKARTQLAHTEGLRTKLAEDPLQIPEIPEGQYNEYRCTFMARHPDLLIADYREPNMKFIERVIRDQLVHDTVQVHRLGEVRLKSEEIIQKQSFSSTCDILLHVSREDILACVGEEEDAVNRITALMMAFEYLGILSYSRFTHNNGSLVGGALDYLAELDRRRRATPGLQFIVLADERIRRQVKELQVDEPAKFRDYAAALHEVLTAHAYIWGECRLEVASAPARGPAPPQLQAATTGTDDTASGATRRSKKNKARIDRMKSDRAELQKYYKEGDRRQRSRTPQRAVQQGTMVDNRRDDPKPKKVPENERSRVVAVEAEPGVGRKCRFWNGSVGCLNPNCGWDHSCCLCGAKHRWVDRHFKAGGGRRD